MKKFSFLGVPVLILALCFVFAACGSATGGPTGGGQGNPADDADTGPVTYTATKNNVTYTLVVTKGVKRVAVGDTYVLTILKNGVETVSTGTVTEVKGSVLTLQPAVKDAPSFNLTVSGEKVTNISGDLTFSDGTSEKAPGSVTSGGGGGGGGGGSSSTSSGNNNSTVSVTGVSLAPTSINLSKGHNRTLTANVTPNNATNKNVTWSSSNANVATVSNGVVTAVKTGNAIITVTTADGSKTATCAVTVSEPISWVENMITYIKKYSFDFSEFGWEYKILMNEAGDELGVLDPTKFLSPFNLGDMASASSNWRLLLGAIEEAGTMLYLDLSKCTMSGNDFNPDSAVNTGKDKIIELQLPNAAKTLPDIGYGNVLFNHFTELWSVEGQNITKIGNNAFNGLESLSYASFPEATSIGNYAFPRSLSEVVAPKVISIGDSAFQGTKITEVNFPELTSIGSNTFTNTKITEVNFPKLTFTGIRAFSGNYELKMVILPELTRVQMQSFANCLELVSVDLPKATFIGDNAFDSGNKLTYINIPMVKSIGDKAFGSLYFNTGNPLNPGNVNIIMGKEAPTLGTNILFSMSHYGTNFSITIKIPAGATGYSPNDPYDGTSVIIDNSDMGENWVNGFRRGGGWDGVKFVDQPNSAFKNFNFKIEKAD